ncbi:MAG: hypothetical protein SVX43_17160, partial [Cyanobacteriota bacterium]|nr:hypothetical protein [Cyanobacteriota bacterium]
MGCFAEPFEQAKQHWNLEKLERDLTEVKQQDCGKRKKITPVELACLRGLLCGCSPTEIAAKLKREPRGLRVDLSRGLYRYVEVLAQREPNELKDWRDVADWLRDYQIRLGSTSDSPIKIVDITLGGSSHIPLLDVKLRNIGQQVAFLKKARFQFYQTWILYSWVAEGKERETDRLSATLEKTYAFSPSRSRAVEPSFDYEINLHPLFESHQGGHFAEKNPSKSGSIAEEFNISQCVDG